jgi:hypothetical protein
VAGSLKPVGSRKRVDLGAPVEGRRFGSGKSVSLTRERRKRSWLLESARGSPNSGRLRGATGSVRGRTSASRMAENARPRRRRHRGGARICTSPKGEQSRVRIGRSWRRAVKRAPSRGRIVARRSGVARKNPTPPAFGRRGEGEASCGQRSASYAPGSRAVHGCSCRESVAEVGEKHLLRAIEGSREANRGRTE